MKITDVSVVLHDRRSQTLAVFRVAPTAGCQWACLRHLEPTRVSRGNAFPEAILAREPRETWPSRSWSTSSPCFLGQDPARHRPGCGHGCRRAIHLRSDGRSGVVRQSRWWEHRRQGRWGSPSTGCSAPVAIASPVYFSSGPPTTVPGPTADEASYWRDRGWKGYKLHPPRALWKQRAPSSHLERHQAQCTAVRAAVGDSMDADARLLVGIQLPRGDRSRGAPSRSSTTSGTRTPSARHDIHGYTRGLKQPPPPIPIPGRPK